MSDRLQATHLGLGGLAQSGARELSTRHVWKDGHRLVRLRAFAVVGGGVRVEAEVQPPGVIGPGERATYAFSTARDADEFMRDALETFAYLGCEIA